MRLSGRLIGGTNKTRSVAALGLLLTLTSCSLPDITVDKRQQRADAAGEGFVIKDDDHTSGASPASPYDKTYLATVHVSLSESAQPVSFDIHRNRGDLISVNMIETEETSTYLHLGYTHSDGGMAGLRFRWNF